MFYNIIFFFKKKEYCARIRWLWILFAWLRPPPPSSSSLLRWLIGSYANGIAWRSLTADPRDAPPSGPSGQGGYVLICVLLRRTMLYQLLFCEKIARRQATPGSYAPGTPTYRSKPAKPAVQIW